MVKTIENRCSGNLQVQLFARKRSLLMSVPAIDDSNDGHIYTSIYLNKTGTSHNLLAGRVQVHTFTFQTNTIFYIYTKSHTHPCVKHTHTHLCTILYREIQYQ